MANKTIITSAVTGAGPTTKKSEHVPVTPKEIAESSIEAAKAGAAIAHIHVRDPETGEMSFDPALYREVVERIRESDTDVIINLTAGGGGDWTPSEENPANGGPGTFIQTPEERHQSVGELLPEICTLDAGSLNFGDMVYINPENWIRKHAELIKESGVKPEIECFDTGYLRMTDQLIAEGLLEGDPLYQLCLGIPWGAAADPETIIYMRDRLPANANWSAFGIGRMQLPIVAQAAMLGGNVRVGLEDNLYLKKGVLATNAQLVDKAVSTIQELQTEPMTPAEAREQLGLRTFTK
ncbi:MAG TPA: 3-keto-5-aminohexanoate cleavage protein [Pseudogracilibacillus sp.]|nr:3-keto-5-aminohexanoate cleavage protein [Pseudogracilibacillus sp.]